MSSDNFHFVGATNDERIGLWRNLSASVEADWEPQDMGEPDETFDDIEQALVRAHQLQTEEPTEYGVSVEPGVLP